MLDTSFAPFDTNYPVHARLLLPFPGRIDNCGAKVTGRGTSLLSFEECSRSGQCVRQLPSSFSPLPPPFLLFHPDRDACIQTHIHTHTYTMPASSVSGRVLRSNTRRREPLLPLLLPNGLVGLAPLLPSLSLPTSLRRRRLP